MKAKRSANQAPQLLRQAAVLPWRRTSAVEILLITSLETGRWVLPKGRMEGRETPRRAAGREALEEAGIEGPIRTRVLGTYQYEKRLPDGGTQRCRVEVYPMQVTVQHQDWPERARRRTKWHSLDEAAHAVAEEELRALILAFDPS